MTTASSFIRSITLLSLLLVARFLFAGEEIEKVKFGIVLGGNVGAVMPFPFSNIPEENGASMIFSPYIGGTMAKSWNEKWVTNVNVAYSAKSVRFKATVVDQPYSGYIEQEVNVNGTTTVREGDIDNAFFSGETEGGFSLKYVQADFLLGRRLGKRNILQLGLYSGLLISSENKLDIAGTVSLGPNLDPITTYFERTIDYSNNIRNLDIGLLLGYERYLFKNLNLNLRLSTGLTSVYEQDFEAVSYAMLNIYSTIGVTWYLNGNFIKLVK